MVTAVSPGWTRILAFLALTVLGAALLAACGGSSPRIALDPGVLDLGEVAQQPLEVNYTVSNQGDGPLIIQRIITSCGCTKAAVDRETIPPGESTQLRVTFDPTEDDLYGDQVRVIYLRSNDPATPEAEVELRVTITEAGQ